jgi:hypothetical protein
MTGKPFGSGTPEGAEGIGTTGGGRETPPDAPPEGPLDGEPLEALLPAKLRGTPGKKPIGG